MSLKVAMKNSVDIFYFACIAPIHVFFSEEGAMEKKTFLNTWKDIPASNETQYTIENVECTSDGIQTKMAQNNVLTILSDQCLLHQYSDFYFQAFTVAKRTLEGQDMIYQSMKLTNGKCRHKDLDYILTLLNTRYLGPDGDQARSR